MEDKVATDLFHFPQVQASSTRARPRSSSGLHWDWKPGWKSFLKKRSKSTTWWSTWQTADLLLKLSKLLVLASKKSGGGVEVVQPWYQKIYNATKKSYFIHKIYAQLKSHISCKNIYISKQYSDVGRVKTWASCGIVDLSHKSRHDSHRLHHLAEIVFKTGHYRRKDLNQRQQTTLDQKAYLCRPAMEELGEELVLSWLSIKTNHPPIPHGFPAS